MWNPFLWGCRWPTGCRIFLHATVVVISYSVFQGSQVYWHQQTPGSLQLSGSIRFWWTLLSQITECCWTSHVRLCSAVSPSLADIILDNCHSIPSHLVYSLQSLPSSTDAMQCTCSACLRSQSPHHLCCCGIMWLPTPHPHLHTPALSHLSPQVHSLNLWSWPMQNFRVFLQSPQAEMHTGSEQVRLIPQTMWLSRLILRNRKLFPGQRWNKGGHFVFLVSFQKFILYIWGMSFPPLKMVPLNCH